MEARGLGLKQQLLLAALGCSQGSVERTFTAEDLLVRAWEGDKMAWGLRGFEESYPDSDKLFKELDAHAGKQGVVGQGLLQKVHRRVYRLTPSGLAAASSLRPSDSIAQEKVGRQLEAAVKSILNHAVFKQWLVDPNRIKHFRQAGHFWGVAPGTPAKTVRERVTSVEHTLDAALTFLRERKVEEIAGQRGQILFSRRDIERCLEFQAALKQRFAKDLRLLDPGIDL